jgi:hypothetical protein
VKEGLNEELILTEQGDLIAWILYSDSGTERGIQFVTEKHEPFQIGVMRYDDGHKLAPHRHKPWKRKIAQTYEVLFVRKGFLVVDFYTSGKRYLCTRRLSPGDVLVQVSGGHGFTFREWSDVVEVKQGPYVGKDKDKEVW